MKTVHKTFSALLLAVFSLITFSGCVPHTELNEKAIILAIGIDYKDEKYKVTFQYYNPTGIGGRTLVDNSQPNVLTSNGEGENVYAALEDASFRCGRELMLGVTQLIVIGEDAAKYSVNKVMEFSKSFFQSHPDMLVTVAEGEAQELMKVKFSEGIVSTQKLKFMLTNAEKSGIVGLPSAIELFTALQTNRKSAALPRLRLLDSGQSDASEDGKTLEISGGVLINDGKAVSDVDIEVMSGLELLCCKTETGTVTINYKDEKISVGLVDIKTKIKPSFEKGRLVFTVDLTSGGRFLVTPQGDFEENNGEMEKMCEDEIIKRMESAVKQTVYEHGADPFLLEKTVRHCDYKLWKEVESDFEEYLKNAEFRFNAKIEIDKLILSK
ncbi:MAG: Ger(x)C family spore germination protein [Ruminococcaceae bacterium]|nr:Ger(x)C family spore germination protein [Oscillospiraceae bacterium]